MMNKWEEDTLRLRIREIRVQLAKVDEGECAECAAATETRAHPCDECGHSDEYGDA